MNLSSDAYPSEKPGTPCRCDVDLRKLITDVDDESIVLVLDIPPHAVGHEDLKRRYRLGYECTDGVKIGMSVEHDAVRLLCLRGRQRVINHVPEQL